jgi:hypothetical protein
MRSENNRVSFEIRLPKNVHIDRIEIERLGIRREHRQGFPDTLRGDIKDIPKIEKLLGEDQEATFKEGARKIGEMSLGTGKLKYM